VSRLILLAFASLLAACVSSPPPTEAPWYEPEIRAFEAADRENPVRPGQVLFVGSSSVRMWGTLAEDMAPAPVLNRGFGGSKTPDVLAVTDRVVLPCRPGVIVYYCGDNDLADPGSAPERAAEGFIAFARRVRARLPGTPILYLSIKPSPARWARWPAMREANALVAAYAEAMPGVEFVDVATCLLGADGTPNPAYYAEDALHLSEAGYAQWTRVLRPRVLEATGGG
jgi:lysophospholipase L1-like esterase